VDADALPESFQHLVDLLDAIHGRRVGHDVLPDLGDVPAVLDDVDGKPGRVRNSPGGILPGEPLRCDPGIQIESYRQRISAPPLDRIDIHVEVPLVDFRELTSDMEQMNFAARAHDRILKVSDTLADLAGKQDIGGNEVLEAIQFRSLDRRLFE
jgi:hypothetical protein